MSQWLSAEQPLIKSLMVQLQNCPLSDMVDGNIFDKPQDDITGDSYIIVGERNVLEQENSVALREEISVTFHIYHYNALQPELTVDETTELVRWLKYYVKSVPFIEHYEITHSLLDTSVSFQDVDRKTQHAVVRMKYRIRHKTKFEKIGVE